MNRFTNGWFTENDDGWKGISQSYEVDHIIAREKSQFQDILIFQAKRTGITMAIDDIIQSTQIDEFAYHEMMAHVALYSHPNPQNVLIIGGGDLGVVREILKHKCVKTVDLCDVDEKVTELSIKYLPHLVGNSLKDPRLHIYHRNGIEYVSQHPDSYDIVITDSCDPTGPATSLFNQNYYNDVAKCLRKDGIGVSQGENFWFNSKIVMDLRDICFNADFKYVEFANICIPTYPTGSIGALLFSREYSSKEPRREMTPEEEESMQYYSKEMHIASFALPVKFKKMFETQ